MQIALESKAHGHTTDNRQTDMQTQAPI